MQLLFLKKEAAAGINERKDFFTRGRSKNLIMIDMSMKVSFVQDFLNACIRTSGATLKPSQKTSENAGLT